MSKREKLYDQVRGNPANVRYEDALRLAKYAGFTHERTTGSHEIYHHPRIPTGILNFQRASDGKAKPYQVKQLMAWIEEHDLLLLSSEDDNGQDDA
jgi:predicted RNA binding protein YcfA (HicA-like mRNA interferase family)